MANSVEQKNGTDRRLFQRFPVGFPLRFKNHNQNREGKGFCWDISAGGVGIFSKERLEPKDRLDLWLQIPDKYDPLSLSGEVVWAEETEPQTWRAGIAFSEIQLISLSRIFRISQIKR